MFFTPKLIKTIKQYLVILLIIVLLRLICDAFGLSGYSLSKPNSPLKIFTNLFILQLLPIAAFWYFVARLTGEKLGVLLAFTISILPNFYGAYTYINEGFDHNAHKSIFEAAVWFRRMGFIVFGFLHFKNSKGFYMVFASLLSLGMGTGNGVYGFKNFVLKPLKLDKLLDLEIEMGESIRRIDVLSPVLHALYVVLGLIIFWWVYQQIKGRVKLDHSLRSSWWFDGMDKLSFSIIFWAFRIPIAFLGFGIIQYWSVLYNPDAFIKGIKVGYYAKQLLQILSFLMAVYVVCSLYRNFLANYLSLKGDYPKWLFLLLNIPIVNFITWLFLLFEKNANQVPKNHEKKASNLSFVESLQSKFVVEEKNMQVKIFVFFGMILFLIGKFVMLNNGTILFVLVYLVLSLLFAWLYMRYNVVMYILFLFQVIFVLFVTGASIHIEFEAESLRTVYSFAGTSNMIILYSLFHFDKLSFLFTQHSEVQQEA